MSGRLSGDFRAYLGVSGAISFGLHVELILIAFSLIVCGLLFDRFCIDVGTNNIWGVLFKGLFGTFPTSNKNAAPDESALNIS